LNVAERKVPVRISNAEIKAGIFLTCCLGLFVFMLFVLGNFGRVWRGRQEIGVIFSTVSSLRRDAPVRYNGMDIGHVKKVKIVRVDDAVLARLPVLLAHDLPNLPLTDDEREALRATRDGNLDKAARAIILGRTMVILTLDVLREGDTQRYRMDDDYRINGSLMGDAAVDIRTGKGSIVPLANDRLFLGISGDMYTDLGKSISQVKDILASMSEIVGGADTRQAIQGQVKDFNDFTARLENESTAMHEKMPVLWAGIDKQLDGAKVTMSDVEAKLAKLQPRLNEALLSTQKAMVETKDGFAKSFSELHEKIKGVRAEVNETTTGWRKSTAHYRGSIPQQIEQARGWSERFLPVADKIDGVFTRADDQLGKGVESTRSMLAGYIDQATNFEEKTFRLKRWPGTFANAPTDDDAQLQNETWRKELGRRQFDELRGEMTSLRQMLGAAGADRARTQRVEQILRETESLLDDRGAGEPIKRGKR